ncbi:MAG TPA: hypothetical protein VFD92_05880 [Candidatus Binatia bacterium]|nr:hypothetical protein [Candidatus Binatia bacterium]
MTGIIRGIAVAAATLGLAVGLVASAAPARADLLPNFRCAVAKRRAALKRLRAVDACFAKVAGPNAQPPDPACIAAANHKLQQEALRIEARGGCQPETGDEFPMERVTDQCESNLIRQVPGTCTEAGQECGGPVAAPCCTGLLCRAVLGQPAFCG